jgi:hypothetical protein
MTELLYSVDDLRRWKNGSVCIATIMAAKIGQYVRGNRIPQQLAHYLQTEAMIAFADGRVEDGLGLLFSSLKNQMTLWRDLMDGHSDKLCRESIKQMGFGPVVGACMVGQSFSCEVASVFERCAPLLESENCVKQFGLFLCEIVNGRRCPPPPLSAILDTDLQLIARAFNARDTQAMSEAIRKGADNWRAAILADRGWPNSVCYLVGIGFIRLARDLWDKSFSVSHFLTPASICDATPNLNAGSELVIPNT